MSFWKTVTKALTSASSVGLDVLKNSPISIPVPDTYFNKALPKVIPGGKIENLEFTAKDGYIFISMQINHASGQYLANTSFALERTNITRTNQRIVVTRLSPLLLLGTSHKTKLYAWAYRAFLSIAPNYDLLKKQLSSLQGLYFNGNKWTLDLQEMGFRNMLEEILKAKMHESYPALTFLVSGTTGLLLNTLAIEDITVQSGKFTVAMRYQG